MQKNALSSSCLNCVHTEKTNSWLLEAKLQYSDKSERESKLNFFKAALSLKG